MAGRARLTTVASRAATPEPSTVASRTHRPAGSASRTGESTEKDVSRRRRRTLLCVGFPRPDEQRRAARRRRALLRAYLTAVDEGVDWSSPRYERLERAFLRIASRYGEEHGISYQAW